MSGMTEWREWRMEKMTKERLEQIKKYCAALPSSEPCKQCLVTVVLRGNLPVTTLECTGIQYCEFHGSVGTDLLHCVEAYEQALAERDHWMELARQENKNVSYYQGLLDKVGLDCGDAAFIADDGTKNLTVLRAKIPNLVAALRAERDALKAKVEELRRRVAPL